MRKRYDHKQCQSLFGYAFAVHVRTGATCQLCGCGGSSLTFDLWRQLTVEHIVGKSQGGYLKDIRRSVTQRFPQLSPSCQESLSRDIDIANTVTACSFCNSVTSQHSVSVGMRELISTSTGEPDEVLSHIKLCLSEALKRKREDVEWKLESVRREYEASVVPAIRPPSPHAG